VAATALLLAACGSDVSRSASSTTSPLAAAHLLTVPACVLVHLDDASGLFAHAARRVKVDNKAKAASVCGYSADSNTDPNTIDNISYDLLVYVYDGTKRFTQTMATDTHPVTDLGDGAFQAVRGDLLSVAFTAHGQTVEIDLSITGLADHPKVDARAVQVIDIARLAISRM